MVSKWEIYFCDLDPTVGSEQRGIRPVIVISTNAANHILPVSTVLPLSSLKPGGKTYKSEILLEKEITGLPKVSVVMIQQIRTVSHARLGNLVGSITDKNAREKISEACREYFDL